MKRSMGRRAQRVAMSTFSKMRDTRPQNAVITRRRPLYKSVSCPCLAASTYTDGFCTDCLPRSYSAIYHTEHKHLFRNYRAVPNQMLVKFSQQRAASTAPIKPQKAPTNPMQNLEAVCACPCPCPCPGGNSLPPPCNTPAKCLQYMTGYYYYPYGTWFCGPYHVSTGPSGPCSGPITPGGPCGPAPPCPGGPCGPPGVTPCCACGPLTCCAVCGLGTPNTPSSSTPHSTVTYSPYAQCASMPFGMYGTYDPYAFNSYMQYNYDTYDNYNSYDRYTTYDPYGYNSYNTYSQYGSWERPNMPNPYFGPGFNVPISPIQVDPETFDPVPPTPKPPTPASPGPKSSVRINPDYLKGTRTIGQPFSNMSNIPKPPIPTRRAPTSSVYLNARVSDPKACTGARPISNAGSPCSKNLTPKPLRPGPPSRYDAACSISRTNPYPKPKINGRTLPHLDTIRICYYTTRSMQKYANKDANLNTLSNVKSQKSAKKGMQMKRDSINANDMENKPLCYWCLLSNRHSRSPCNHCEMLTSAHKKVPLSDIRSKSFNSYRMQRKYDGEVKQKRSKQCNW